MITFKQQFDKLTEAYIRGEVNPCDPCACFVGNLLNKTKRWYNAGNSLTGLRDRDGMEFEISKEANGFYTPEEILVLEDVFMCYSRGGEDEDKLFEAFSKTLDLLKQIHESKGEIVEPFEFVKRQSIPV